MDKRYAHEKVQRPAPLEDYDWLRFPLTVNEEVNYWTLHPLHTGTLTDALQRQQLLQDGVSPRELGRQGYTEAQQYLDVEIKELAMERAARFRQHQYEELYLNTLGEWFETFENSSLPRPDGGPSWEQEMEVVLTEFLSHQSVLYQQHLSRQLADYLADYQQYLPRKEWFETFDNTALTRTDGGPSWEAVLTGYLSRQSVLYQQQLSRQLADCQQYLPQQMVGYQQYLAQQMADYQQYLSLVMFLGVSAFTLAFYKIGKKVGSRRQGSPDTYVETGIIIASKVVSVEPVSPCDDEVNHRRVVFGQTSDEEVNQREVVSGSAYAEEMRSSGKEVKKYRDSEDREVVLFSQEQAMLFVLFERRVTRYSKPGRYDNCIGTNN